MHQPASELPDPDPDPAVGAGVARYTLVGPCGRTFRDTVPGTLGGHRRGRLYGRLDCPSALRVIAQGGYVRDRVFFRDEATAVAAGYRPCAVCLPREYRRWKSQQESPACRARWDKEGTT
ncbi:Ada metal-binding domain-containing protein [Streptomyces sp. SID13588]|uniref:Ada metal-binding domain-containing protein n=1 Tax=Streptomyces sp. SID13588 TaxID=2706051 RepID=UPI0013C792B2|nr:Ada metal-binding domain-containing protein [Streptomyces sp. SID13588]NEA69338.1 metal-binding protein [Streptomyces sp. SID13588]